MSRTSWSRPHKCPHAGCDYAGGTELALASHLELRHGARRPAPPPTFSLDEPQAPRLRVAIYARVSTDDKDQDPTQQLAPCRAEAARRGWDIVWEGCDYESGTIELWNRAEGANLWKLVNNRSIDAIITYDASRLSRESAVAVMNLLAGLGKRGVGYVSATESILDTASDNDFKDIILAFIAWANNFYVKQLRRASKRGKDASRARGIPQGAHVKGCGVVTICPTGAHETGTGRSLRPPRKRKGPRAAGKPPHPTSPPPESSAAPPASPPHESRGR